MEIFQLQKNFEASVNIARIELSLKIFIQKIAMLLGSSMDLDNLTSEVDKLVEFEKSLGDVRRIFSKYFRWLMSFDLQNMKKHRAFKKKTNIKIKPVENLKLLNKYVLWMELFAPNILVTPSKVSVQDVPDDFNAIYFEFLSNTPKRLNMIFYKHWNIKFFLKFRTIANYIGWRIIQASLFFLGNEAREAFLEFEKTAYGKQDFEQR